MGVGLFVRVLEKVVHFIRDEAPFLGHGYADICRALPLFARALCGECAEGNRPDHLLEVAIGLLLIFQYAIRTIGQRNLVLRGLDLENLFRLVQVRYGVQIPFRCNRTLRLHRVDLLAFVANPILVARGLVVDIDENARKGLAAETIAVRPRLVLFPINEVGQAGDDTRIQMFGLCFQRLTRGAVVALFRKADHLVLGELVGSRAGMLGNLGRVHANLEALCVSRKFRSV